MILFFIRHGESTSNKKKVYQGWTDTNLSKKGKFQAKQLNNYLLKQKIQFDSIYSSPLQRAYETANYLIQCSKNPRINILEGMKSINVGTWAGVPIDTVKTKHAKEYQLWHDTPTKFCFPRGESVIDVFNRSKEALINVLNNHNNKDTIAIVSHMITIKTLMLGMLGKSLDLLWQQEFNVPNTGIIIFEIQKDKATSQYYFQKKSLKSPVPHLEPNHSDKSFASLLV